MMNLEEFTRALESEFEDVEPGTISPDTNYRDIPGFSSMYALIIIAFIDNEFDILLSGEELKNANTVRDLHTIITSKK